MNDLVARLREARICEHEPELDNDKLIGLEAADRIEALEAELEWMTEHALCGEVVISGCHTTIAQLAAEIETAKMERFVVDDDLAESRHVNAKLNEEHRDLAETLAEANAKIARVEAYRDDISGDGNIPDRYFFEGDDANIVEGLDAALADPTKLARHTEFNVAFDLHRNHVAPLLALVRAAKEQRDSSISLVLQDFENATPDMMREIEYSLRLGQIESAKLDLIQ